MSITSIFHGAEEAVARHYERPRADGRLDLARGRLGACGLAKTFSLQNNILGGHFPYVVLLLIVGVALCVAIQQSLCDPLVNFQVAQPPPFILDTESLQCTVTILQSVSLSRSSQFVRTHLAGANLDPPLESMQLALGTFTPYMLMLVISSPEIAQPPTGCSSPNVWDGVTLNLTVQISGTQLPRLAFFTFQNIEIWGSSTLISNESGDDGIVWTYVKDVTRFIPLFSEPGTFILQLDNDVEPGLDGEFACESYLHLRFRRDYSEILCSDTRSDNFLGVVAKPARTARGLDHSIIPLTNLANNTGDEASVPPGFSVEVTLPQNAVTAFAELQACANSRDMFWFLSYFVPGTVGEGPFREVRVLVNGQVAGVAFPYPFVTAGGTAPPGWRPIAPYGALDMPTYHPDLTPFIPILTNGQPHNITLISPLPSQITKSTKNVNLDSSTLPTTGNITLYKADDYTLSTASGSNDSDINIIVNASRSIHVEAEIIAGSGAQTKVVFTQNLEYGSVQNYL
ncbi:peptide N-acetyl-beta-D-glucosaminyl asparaginase amidase A-domain-containing protein [Lactarius sanguifluus]|nr:peptide N-acetyl-beta-D-glucosaminyl asparaginase amidase A-domain-containing protein [Lactarius sanguifluus]